MKISIITATYNSGATLRDTLESVLAQTYGDFEHIIKDGGSTDNTLEIVKEYEGRYRGRLKVISAPDHGIYDAMNAGIAAATGDVVGLLNSDDFFSCDDALATIARAFDDSKVEAVYGDVHYVDSSDLARCVRYYSSKGFRLWKMHMGVMPAHPSFYCRRKIYERLGSFDTSFKIAADFECMLRFLYVNKINTRYIRKDFVTMRTGGASSSGMSSHKRIWTEHARAYKKNGVYSNALLEGSRYIFKVFDLIKSRLKGAPSEEKRRILDLEKRLRTLECRIADLEH